MSNDVEASALGTRAWAWEQPIAWFVLVMAITLAVPFAIAALVLNVVQRSRDHE